jgi:uncharacterized YccA/Bax inhibitor family protein
MKSNNPVFNNSPAFNGQGANAYGNQSYPGAGAAYPAYGQQPASDTTTWGAPGAPVQTDRALTIDDVVQKTGLSLGLVVVVAAALWIGTGDLTTESSNYGTLIALTGVGMIASLVIGLVAAFKRKMLSPAFVLAYAAAEGLFMGGVSKIYQANTASPIVMQAILGTVFAAAGMLAAYKFFNIKIGDKFRRGFIAASFGFLGLALMEVVLSAFGHGLGLFDNGGMGFIFALAGLGFGVVGLLLDFDMVENGIRAGVSQRFAWTAAFGLTASLVMVYFYLLRLLSILNQD